MNKTMSLRELSLNHLGHQHHQLSRSIPAKIISQKKIRCESQHDSLSLHSILLVLFIKYFFNNDDGVDLSSGLNPFATVASTILQCQQLHRQREREIEKKKRHRLKHLSIVFQRVLQLKYKQGHQPRLCDEECETATQTLMQSRGKLDFMLFLIEKWHPHIYSPCTTRFTLLSLDL